MNESKIIPDTPVRMADAIRYRDGLMIALLGFIPRILQQSRSAVTSSRRVKTGLSPSPRKTPRRRFLSIFKCPKS
jgi:hypothetical protein